MNKKTLAIVVVVALLVVAGIYAATRDKGLPDEIKIGANFELTGGAAMYGTEELNGLRLAVDEANASGDLKSKIVIVQADNQTNGAEAANQARKLITQDKVVAIVGPAISGLTLAAAPVAQENKIPLISPSATAVEVTAEGEYIFRACFLDSTQGKIMGEFAYNKLNSRNAAILYAKSEYGEGLAKYFKEQYTALGGKIVAEEAFQDGDNDFNTQLTKIKNTKPDLIYVPGYYTEQAYIAKQARSKGITVPLTGGDGWDSLKTLNEIAGTANITNIYYTNHYSPADPDPAVQAFVTKYKETYGSEPTAFAALGYESGRILVDAIKRAGTADSKKIRDAIAATDNFKALAANISFDADRNPVKDLVIVQLTNGQQSVKETIVP